MSSKGQRIGYIRVSSYDQNPVRQLEHLEVDPVFTDKASGTDSERPQLQALLPYAREGDTIVIHSMDRLARNVDDLRQIVLGQTGRGVRIQLASFGVGWEISKLSQMAAERIPQALNRRSGFHKLCVLTTARSD
jgi:DNA invertase Pin-like site-specific DNA recombinase